MLRGNPPPPPPQHPFFSFSFYLFSFTFQKKSENFGGGFEPPEPPPLKYALAIGDHIITDVRLLVVLLLNENIII